MVSSKKSISLRRRSRRTGGGGAPPFKNIMKHYERLVDYIDVDNVKTRTSMWEYLHSCMTKHLRVDDSMRQRSDEGTEDYVRNITSVMDKTISEAVAADALDTAEPAPTRMEIIEHLDDVFGIPCFDEPPTLFSRVDKPPTLPSSEEAESVLPSHEMEKVDCSANKNNVIEDCSSSFDIAPEETTDHSEDCESDRERVKTIRFADEDGLPMETVYMLGGPDDPAAVGRVVVLLLKPEVRKFEFIYAEYRLNSKTSVSNLLEQLPGMASHEILTAQTYSSLFRSREGCSELIGALPLQDCRLDKNEVIIGVMSGYSGQGIMKCALPLIYNDKLSKVVKQAKRTGRGLRHILSGEELEEERENKRLEQQQQDAARSVALDVMFGECKEDCPEPLQVCPHNASAASPPYKLSDETTAYCSVLADFRYVVSDDARPKMTQLLYVGLVATIGILYSLSEAQ